MVGWLHGHCLYCFHQSVKYLVNTFSGSVSTSSQTADSGVQGSSSSARASASQSSLQYQTMSLRNGMYYMEVDVQVSVIKTDGQNYHTDNKIFFKYPV